ncbi:hypothetical protein EMMF5_006580, partial [Cystobasidiomycetes sp. EMM_F5]
MPSKDTRKAKGIGRTKSGRKYAQKGHLSEDIKRRRQRQQVGKRREDREALRGRHAKRVEGEEEEDEGDDDELVVENENENDNDNDDGQDGEVGQGEGLSEEEDDDDDDDDDLQGLE